MLITLLMAVMFLAVGPMPVAANPDPEEVTLASDCRDSGDEFQAEWNAACLD